MEAVGFFGFRLPRVEADVTARKHIDWIDTFKGIGILLVVLGHVYNRGLVRDWIFLFHMPAFFFIAGLTFRLSRSPREQLQRDAWRLLIPYAAFLHLIYPAMMLISIARSPQHQRVSALGEQLVNLLAGGPLLLGWASVFWFITCLFLTKQAYHSLRTRMSLGSTGVAVLLLSATGLAVSYFWPMFWLPWCADVVLIAIFFFWLGEFISDLRQDPRAARVAAGVGIAAAAAGCYGILNGEPWSMMLKNGDYGVPVLSLLLAGGTIVALIEVAIVLDRIPGFCRFLRYCGQASLAIMFMHQPLQLILRNFFGVADPALRLGVTLVGCLLAYELMRRTMLTRALYLGSIVDQRRLFRGPAREMQG